MILDIVNNLLLHVELKKKVSVLYANICSKILTSIMKRGNVIMSDLDKFCLK